MGGAKTVLRVRRRSSILGCSCLRRIHFSISWEVVFFFYCTNEDLTRYPLFSVQFLESSMGYAWRPLWLICKHAYVINCYNNYKQKGRAWGTMGRGKRLFSLPIVPRAQQRLQQRRRRRLRERRLKSEAELLQTLSRLFHLVQFVKCWQFVLELNSKGLYQSSGKEKESLRCVHVLYKTWN